MDDDGRPRLPSSSLVVGEGRESCLLAGDALKERVHGGSQCKGQPLI